MASIIVEIPLAVPADVAWAVIGDWATGPARMAPGWVTDVRTENDQRVVTFAHGAVFRERLVGLDPRARRLAYSITGGAVRPDHHNASMHVLPDGRLRWIHDVLPDALAPRLETGVTASAKIIKATLESL
nr:SRPBCC family protein [uncultured Actinoplanes sp.]